MAPEVHKAEGYHASADIWSVGVLLYWCLCGTPPYTATPSITVLPTPSSSDDKQANEAMINAICKWLLFCPTILLPCAAAAVEDVVLQ